MLIGTAEGKEFVEPTEKTVFYEDLTAEQRVLLLKEKIGEVLPAGLVNLGNTCYMNSSVQCLKRIKEFRQHLSNY
jgi:ubiquitin carboxyl-terminal hydrolase 14